ncbi:hypothetical protein BJB45_03600 [Halomonas huangheensis]|uniref:Uncharacterized protein n=1 Tax=Halomonas huangheensis TaxID=1178482 RepID=W1N3Z4_9GAMM|nr:hypothetical protein BJB45_03600 [Halomonas huangheensis]
MEIDYLNREKGLQWVMETREIAAMLTGLIRKQSDIGEC